MTPTPKAQAPAAAPDSATPRVSHGLAAFALALLLGLQPVTTDVYLPALPMLARDLAAPMSAAQLTMSALILAFGLAQLVWGPVADRLGRRPVLITGLLLYTAASIGSVLAGSIGWLVWWRVLQGATMAAAVVCARAIVRDLYEPMEGARVMSLALSGLGVIAIAGPALGGVVAALGGWRAALAVVAAFGALALAFIAWRLPETLLHKNPDATRAGPLLAQWSQIARHPTFIAWTLLVSATYGGLFTILAGSSFTYIDVLGLSPGWYGLAMASGSLSYLAGTFVCRRWIGRHGIRGAVARGGGFTLAGGVIIVALALAGVQSVWAIVVPQWLFAFGHGIHQPCGQAAVVGPFPQHAGAASALAGFILAAVAVAVGAWLGVAMNGTVYPLVTTVGAMSVATAIAPTVVTSG